MARYLALLVFLLSIPLAAQQLPAAPKAPAAPQAPAAPRAPTAPAHPTPPAPPAVAVDLEAGGQAINIRLDVSVMDQAGAGIPQPKSLMVMLVDRAFGRTRAAFEDRSILVDARPVVVEGRIRVNMTIISESPRSIGPSLPKDPTIEWRNGFSLLLESGKPMLALETTDAVTKRKMSIEVKATIVK